MSSEGDRTGMLNAIQLSRKIAELGQGLVSPDDFEDWFRVHSRNVHQWGSPELLKAVFSLESVLSEYRFAELDEAGLKQGLAAAILPFEDVASVCVPKVWSSRSPIQATGNATIVCKVPVRSSAQMQDPNPARPPFVVEQNSCPQATWT